MTRAEPADIAIISNEPTPYRLHVLGRLARELPEVRIHNIFTHTVATPSMPWSVKLEPRINPVFFAEHHLSAGNRGLARQVRLFRALRGFLVRQDVKLIILLGYNDLARLLLIRWAKRRGLPLLLTGDSNIFGEGRVRGLRRLVKRPMVRWVLRNVAGLMPMGTCGRAYFRSFMDHRLPTFLFPYEPDYDALLQGDPMRKASFGNRHEMTPERRRLLYCGRLVAVKRVSDLIDAFAKFAFKRAEWDLVIAGDGPLKAQLQARVPAELRHRVKWLGFLQFEDTVACYHYCDVLVLPSEYEPWAVVINEAVACGLAVVATEVVGAATELVRHRGNGMIVPPRNVPLLAEALEYATDPHVCQWMKQASPAVLRDWRKAADPVDGVKAALRHFRVGENHG